MGRLLKRIRGNADVAERQLKRLAKVDLNDSPEGYWLARCDAERPRAGGSPEICRNLYQTRAIGREPVLPDCGCAKASAQKRRMLAEDSRLLQLDINRQRRQEREQEEQNRRARRRRNRSLERARRERQQQQQKAKRATPAKPSGKATKPSGKPATKRNTKRVAVAKKQSGNMKAKANKSRVQF